MLRVLGIDPSLSSTGWALASAGLYGDPGWTRGTIKTKPVSTHPLTLLRFDEILSALDAALGPLQPNLAVIEGPAFAQSNGKSHERAGLWWAIYNHIARERSISTLVIGPTLRSKYATGRGNAGKDEVMLAVAKRYPEANVSNNNEADAVALAAMGARWLGKEFDKVPLAHEAAMKTLIAAYASTF